MTELDAGQMKTRALQAVRQVLVDGNEAIVDTIWVGPGLTLLDLVEGALAGISGQYILDLDDDDDDDEDEDEEEGP